MFFPLPVFVWLLALGCKTGYLFDEMILWFDHEGLCIHVLRARENLTKWSCKSLVSQDCCLALLWKTPHCAFSIAQRIWKVRQFRQSESSRSQMHASEVLIFCWFLFWFHLFFEEVCLCFLFLLFTIWINTVRQFQHFSTLHLTNLYWLGFVLVWFCCFCSSPFTTCLLLCLTLSCACSELGKGNEVQWNPLNLKLVQAQKWRIQTYTLDTLLVPSFF